MSLSLEALAQRTRKIDCNQDNMIYRSSIFLQRAVALEEVSYFKCVSIGKWPARIL